MSTHHPRRVALFHAVPSAGSVVRAERMFQGGLCIESSSTASTAPQSPLLAALPWTPSEVPKGWLPTSAEDKHKVQDSATSPHSSPSARRRIGPAGSGHSAAGELRQKQSRRKPVSYERIQAALLSPSVLALWLPRDAPINEVSETLTASLRSEFERVDARCAAVPRPSPDPSPGDPLWPGDAPTPPHLPSPPRHPSRRAAWRAASAARRARPTTAA